MKKALFTFLITCSSIFTHAQNITIPDANLKNLLVNTNCVDTNSDYVGDIGIDLNDDDEIQLSEAENVLSLIINGQEIQSLEGIQQFPNLEYLICRNTQITTLDVSGMNTLTLLSCTNNNQLTEMNLNGLTNLETLECDNNNLLTVDASQTSAEFFSFGNNPNLTHINIRNGVFSHCTIFADEEIDYTCAMFLHLPSLQTVCLDDDEFASNSYISEFPQENVQFGTDCAALVGIEDYTADEFTIYPNPVINTITIQTANTSVIESIKIYNMLGQLVMSENATEQVNVSHLKSGSYIIEINSDKGRTVKNIIKQ